MKAEVHEEGSGVLQAVGGEVVQTAEVVGHQPLDQALLYHLLPYQAPGAVEQGVISTDDIINNSPVVSLTKGMVGRPNGGCYLWIFGK